MAEVHLGRRARVEVEKDFEADGVRLVVTSPHEASGGLGLVGVGHILTKEQARDVANMLLEAAE